MIVQPWYYNGPQSCDRIIEHVDMAADVEYHSVVTVIKSQENTNCNVHDVLYIHVCYDGSNTDLFKGGLGELRSYSKKFFCVQNSANISYCQLLVFYR